MTGRLDIAPCPPADRGLLFQLAEVAFASERGWDAARVLDALDHDRVFVARDDGPAGYVALRTESDICVVVDQLLVAPGHERMGVGHRLLEYAEQYAIERRASVLRIAVESDNSAARNFYRRAGFLPVERELFELDLERHTPQLT